MNGSHVAGGGIAAVLGTIAVAALKAHGIDLSDVDSTLLGAGALAAGAGLGHALVTYGLVGIGKLLLHGSPKPPVSEPAA